MADKEGPSRSGSGRVMKSGKGDGGSGGSIGTDWIGVVSWG